MDERQADGERATALLGLFSLGLRNKSAAMDVLVKFGKQAYGQIQGEVRGSGAEWRQRRCSSTLSRALCCKEIATKSEDTAVRESLESAVMVAAGAIVKASCPRRSTRSCCRFIATTDGDDVVGVGGGIFCLYRLRPGKSSQARPQ